MKNSLLSTKIQNEAMIVLRFEYLVPPNRMLRFNCHFNSVKRGELRGEWAMRSL